MQEAQLRRASSNKPNKVFLDHVCARTGERVLVRVKADRGTLVAIEVDGRMYCNIKVAWMNGDEEAAIVLMKTIAEQYIEGSLVVKTQKHE